MDQPKSVAAITFLLLLVPLLLLLIHFLPKLPYFNCCSCCCCRWNRATVLILYVGFVMLCVSVFIEWV